MTQTTDWGAMLLTLRRMHYSTARVSVLIKTARSTVMGWLDGAEPRHCDGERLIALWSEVTRLPREDLPQRYAKCRDSVTHSGGYSAHP